MAKSGSTSSIRGDGNGRSAETRRQLVDAAVATLTDHGFVGASARTIAERAGVNQGLIFYHFGSVTNLLLAALDAVSDARLEQYATMLDLAHSPTGLVDAAATIFRTDLDAGYLTVLVEMIAGASSSPELGAAVADRIAPWRTFAQEAIESTLAGSPLGGLLPSADVAYAIVALYLGLEMLSHLDGDRRPAEDLFTHARHLAQLMEALTTTTHAEEPR